MFGAGDPLGRLPASRRGGKAAEAGLAQAGRERITDLAHGIDDLIDFDRAAFLEAILPPAEQMTGDSENEEEGADEE